MKKVLILLALHALTGIAIANLLSNPGFEEGPTGHISQPIPGWNTWGPSGWHHDDAGRTIDTKAVKLWWSDAGYWQDIEVEEGHTYTFSCWMQWHNTDPLGVDKKGVLKVEWYDAAEGQLDVIVFGEITSSDPIDTWIEFSTSQVAPADAVVGRIVLAMEVTGPGDNGAVNYDNASIYEFYGQAYAPDPVDGADVNLSLDDLFWSNREAINPGDTITCDVYFEDEGIIVEPNLPDPNFIPDTPIATGVTTGTINLTAEGVTLLDGHTYTWRVDSTDPNSGGEGITTPGRLWTFKVADTPPVVDADVDTVSNIQYTWVDEIDADSDPNKVTLLLSGAYTDDGKSPIIRAVFEEGAHEQAGGTIVTIGEQVWTRDPNLPAHTSGTVTAPVTITNPVAGQTANGLYRFWLNVEDSAGNSANETTRIVYLTCIEAATNDPDDPMYEQWINGDIDGDCNTNLVDFSILASYWVECMTPKAGCN